jgi:ribosome maturation factor RimP
MREADVAAVVGPVVTAAGLEIDRLEIASAGRRSIVRIYLDGDGELGRGPTLDAIADATRAISAALDASSVTGSAPYVLEVSSRGVTRPLTEPKHYRRNLGRLVAAQLRNGSQMQGRITSVEGETVVLTMDSGEHTLSLSDVIRAVVQVELNRPLTPEEAVAFEAADDDDQE